MKKILALLLAVSVVLAFAACAKKPAAEDPTETAAAPQSTDAGTQAADADATEAQPATDAALTPGEYPAVTYGRITCIEAPEGWHIAEESADWRIVYVQDETDASIQLTTDEDPADKLFKRVTEQRDANGEAYTSETITIGGIEFVTMVPELGIPAMYGTVDDQTLVVTFSKDVDLQSQAVTDILGNTHIAPEE